MISIVLIDILSLKYSNSSPSQDLAYLVLFQYVLGSDLAFPFSELFHFTAASICELKANKIKVKKKYLIMAVFLNCIVLKLCIFASY